MSPSVGPDSLVSALSPSDRQIVEILKALSREPRIMILDEATASLGARQVERLFELVGEWKAQGHGPHLHLAPHGGDLPDRRQGDRAPERQDRRRGGPEGDERGRAGRAHDRGRRRSSATSSNPRKVAVEKAVLLETEDLRSSVLNGVSLQAAGGRDPGPRRSAGTGAVGPPARPFRGRPPLGDRPARGRGSSLLSPPAGDAEGPRIRPRRPGRRGPSADTLHSGEPPTALLVALRGIPEHAAGAEATPRTYRRA